MHTFFIAPTGFGVGLTSVSLGLVRALDNIGLRVGFYKPITYKHDTDSERSSLILNNVVGLDSSQSITLSEAEAQLGNNNGDALMEDIVERFQNIASDYQVMIVEGLVPTRNTPYASSLNAEVAKSLSAEIILVTSSKEDNLNKVADKLRITAETFGGIEKKQVLGYIINKMSEQDFMRSTWTDPLTLKVLPEFKNKPFQAIGHIVWNSELRSPRTSDIAEYLGAYIINEGEIKERRVTSKILCARTAANIIPLLKPGTLVITPGDRDDIILAVGLAAVNGVQLAGLLLTSDISPNQAVSTLCNQARKNSGLPIMRVATNSYDTAAALDRMSDEIPLDDTERVDEVMNVIAGSINANWLKDRCGADLKPQMSPPAFRYQLVSKASKAAKCIVLPEGNEPRTIQAAIIAQQRKIANCILLGDVDEITQAARDNGLEIPEGLVILDPENIRHKYVEPMVELRKGKGLLAPMAEAQLEDNVVLGTMMLALDEVDGLVSGAIHTTANTIRPAFQLIKTKPECNIVSSIFFMLLPDQVLVYGDCAVNPDPTAEELAEIAIQSADSAAAFGIPPKVAMISYSTGSSGTGSEVEKVCKATEIAKQKRPDLIIDGPLQYDAATTESVARSKAPDSEVAGQATVLIFPDLNTGNTTYKAVQRSANVISVGPMLQGLRKPVNDLSRGALIDDIVFTIALTAIQADNN